MGERHTRRGNRRLRSSPDFAIFCQKEPELMTKMVVLLVRSSSDKCVARHPTCLLPLEPSFTRILLDMMPLGFSKGDKEEEGALHYFTIILLAIEGEREGGNSHTTRVCNLSELVETWPMRVSVTHRASGLFIILNGRRDNHKRELKKGKRKASDVVKAGTVSP
jgi:hypothetical protein